jgi:predicted nucleotidyltransferase
MDANESHMRRISEYMKLKDVERAYLFGSLARGTQSRRSDVDLIVIEDTDKPFFDRYDDFTDLLLEMPFAVDLLIYTPDEWRGVSRRPFFKKVLEEAKVIYER